MRKIKFRAWHPMLHRFSEVFKVGSYPHYPTMPGGSVSAGRFDGVDVQIYCQFTGLLDKNGKEIYEGDIFNLRDPNIKYVVEWIDCGLKGRQFNNLSYVGLEHWKDIIEIIGNIYENGELIK